MNPLTKAFLEAFPEKPIDHLDAIIGWHRCPTYEGKLIGPGMPEFAGLCRCFDLDEEIDRLSR